jgi:hypothetical protein
VVNVLFEQTVSGGFGKGPARTLNRASVWDLYELQWTVFFFGKEKGLTSRPSGVLRGLNTANKQSCFLLQLLCW